MFLCVLVFVLLWSGAEGEGKRGGGREGRGGEEPMKCLKGPLGSRYKTNTDMEKQRKNREGRGMDKSVC